MKIDTCFAYYAEKCPDLSHRLFFNTYNFNKIGTIVILTVKEYLRSWKSFLEPFSEIKIHEVDYIAEEAFAKKIIPQKVKNLLEGSNDFQSRTDGFRFLYTYIYPEIFEQYIHVGAISPHLLLSYNIPALGENKDVYKHYNDVNRDLFLANKFLMAASKKQICAMFNNFVSQVGNCGEFKKTVNLQEFAETTLNETKTQTLVYPGLPDSSAGIMNTGVIEGEAYSLNSRYSYISIPNTNFLNLNFSEVDWSAPLNFCLDNGEFSYHT
jgi:hypothetical protein